MSENYTIELGEVTEPMTETLILNRIGQVTRLLHDSLTGIGLDKILEQVARDIPNARDRLSYVAKMTEQAAERVLNATDAAIPLQTELLEDTSLLENYWKSVLANRSLRSEYNQAANETIKFLAKTRTHTAESKEILMDIMMAQDFQDLTGQVIKQVTNLAHDMEKQLLQVLLDFSPSAHAKDAVVRSITMNDQQNTQDMRDDVFANQEQVDTLLENLGF